MAMPPLWARIPSSVTRSRRPDRREIGQDADDLSSPRQNGGEREPLICSRSSPCECLNRSTNGYTDAAIMTSKVDMPSSSNSAKIAEAPLSQRVRDGGASVGYRLRLERQHENLDREKDHRSPPPAADGGDGIPRWETAATDGTISPHPRLAVHPIPARHHQ